MQLSEKEIRDIIEDEIIVDCYSREEALMGWWHYLQNGLNFPFEAECEIKTRKGYQLEKVTVVDSVTEGDDFGGNAFYVEIEYNDLFIPARLVSLRNINANEQTLKTITVWNYETQ